MALDAGRALTARPAFRLTKWYLDAVTEDGEAFVAYHAALAWRRLAARWASLLHRAPGAGTRTVSSARAGAAPCRSGVTVVFRSRPLGLEGRWDALDPAHETELFRSPAGSVVWRCLAPRARVTLTPRDGRLRAGFGYAEALELTIPPWRLPIDELLWGRFGNDATSIVWIEWRGAEPKRLVLRDGSVVEHAQIDDDAILLCDGGRLSLSERVTLREGRIGATVLSALRPALALPGALLAADETKWLSRALFSEGGRASSGWAIHERVRFR